jgi:pimeloyl-ACP methyl ester carboxylesterase
MKFFKILYALIAVASFFWLDADALTLQAYPYPLAYFKVENQGQSLKMAYMDIQPKKANGQTVLLLHGKYFNGRYWQDVIQHLTDAGYRVVVPDQIGFGQSSQPGHFQYSFQQLAINTRDLLDYLHINRVLVIGHSMGGMLATRFALMFPEHTSALILEDPIGLEDWRRYIPYHTVVENYQSELKQTPATVKQYEKISYYHGAWKPEYDQWINTGLLDSPDYKRIAWNSALQSDMIFTQPVMYEFKDLKMPVLLIIGELDRTVIGRNWASAITLRQLGNYPVLGKLTAAAIPNAQLVLIPGVGHIPHIENPPAFYTALMPFLSKVS